MASSVRTFTANSIIFADSSTTLNNSANLAWSGTVLTIAGGLTFTGAQTIQTSTGNLTLATAAGNGNVVVTPHGTGYLSVTNGIINRGFSTNGSNNNSNYITLTRANNTGEDNVLQWITASTSQWVFGSGSSYFGGEVFGLRYAPGSTNYLTMSTAGLLTLGGSLTFTGAQTIQTSTGILTVTGTGGLTLTSGTSNTLLTQNSVNVFTSEGSGAIVNTLYLKTGYVGIGTTAPRGLLEVSSGTANTGAAADSIITGPNYTMAGTVGNLKIVTNTDQAADIGGSIAFGGRYLDSIVADATWATIKGGKNNGTSSQYGGYLAFGTRTTGSVTSERMRIDTSGNVGIGTTVPGVKFHAVLGGTAPSIVAATQTVAVFQNSAAAGDLARVNITSGNTASAALQLGDNDDDDIGGIYYDNATNYLGFRTNNVSDRMVILSTGNVGIGTTAPDRVLEINSATGINLRLTYNDTDGSAANYADLLTTSAGGLTLIPSGNLINIGGGTTATQLRFLEPSGSGTNYSSFKAVAQAADINYSLPPTVGAAGTQLTDAAGDGVLTWAAAASTRKAKNIISKFSDSKKALEKVLGVSVYNFKYKKGYGTGDNDTEYTGIMADEAPWAMHFKEEILNPVNTFGYTVLSIQALNKKIEKLEKLISELLSRK